MDAVNDILPQSQVITVFHDLLIEWQNKSISENITNDKILKAVRSFTLVDAVFLHQTKRRIFCLE